MNDAALAAGQTVLWLVPPEEIHNDLVKPVELGFSSIFWNTAWAKRQPPTLLEILCDACSPLFTEFPTKNFSSR